MTIESILKKVQTAIRCDDMEGTYLSLEELHTLENRNALRVFSLTLKADDFEQSTNIVHCIENIKNKDNLMYVLEFIILNNRVLKDAIYSSLGRWFG